MGFNAAERVSALDYDFTTMDPCPTALRKCKGIIPEPSDEMMDTFIERFHRLMDLLATASVSTLTFELSEKARKMDEAPETLTVDEALAKWHEPDDDLSEGRRKANGAVVELLADICQGTPSKAEIEAMPGRTRAAFLQWLVMELLTPKEELIGMTTSAEETPVA